MSTFKNEKESNCSEWKRRRWWFSCFFWSKARSFLVANTKSTKLQLGKKKLFDEKMEKKITARKGRELTVDIGKTTTRIFLVVFSHFATDETENNEILQTHKKKSHSQKRPTSNLILLTGQEQRKREKKTNLIKKNKVFQMYIRFFFVGCLFFADSSSCFQFFFRFLWQSKK